MSIRQKRRIIIGIAITLLLIFAIERTYNYRDEFQVTAKEASQYDFIEAKLEYKHKIFDFNYLYETLEENYPFFKVNERLNGIDWLGNKSKYRRMIRNTKNDAEYFVALDRILGDLNNKHVKIFEGKEYKKLYKTYYEDFSRQNKLEYLPMYDAFSNPFVMERYDFTEDLGDIQLYDEPVLETKILIEDELAYIKIKEMAGFHKAKEDLIELKEFLKDAEAYEKLIIDIRGNSGGKDEYWENILKLLSNSPLNVKYYAFFKGGHRYELDPYKVEGATTIKVLEDNILSKFPEEIKEDFNYYKEEFINIEPQESGLDFRGKVYLIVDRYVFASAENFASFVKDSGFATLVGETTGGNRVFEEVPVIHLPRTKFAVKYSREMGINQDGTINMETKTTPHIKADPTYNEDFNRDECIQEVIKD